MPRDIRTPVRGNTYRRRRRRRPRRRSVRYGPKRIYYRTPSQGRRLRRAIRHPRRGPSRQQRQFRSYVRHRQRHVRRQQQRTFDRQVRRIARRAARRQTRRAVGGALRNLSPGLSGAMPGVAGFRYSSDRLGGRVARAQSRLYHTPTPLGPPSPQARYRIPDRFRGLYRKSFAKKVETHVPTAGRYRERATRELERTRPKKKRRPSIFEEAVGLTGAFMGAQTPQTHEALRNAGRDLVSLPTNVVAGGYYTGRALYKAARGHPAEARQLYRQFKQTDPVALAVQGKFAKASRAGLEHPVATALEIAGPIRGGSRLVSRGADLRRGVRTVDRTNIAQSRRYSPGVLERRVQKARDARGRKVARDLRHEADRIEEHDAGRAADLRQKANEKDPDYVPDAVIHHQVDVVQEGLGQSVRRPHRHLAKKAFTRALKVAHGDRLIRGVSHGWFIDRKSALAHLKHLDDEAGSITSKRKLKANRMARKDLRDALADPDVDWGAIHRAARTYALHTKQMERELIARKMLDPDEAEHARLKDYAVIHAGAEDVEPFGLIRGPHVARARELADEWKAAKRGGGEWKGRSDERAAELRRIADEGKTLRVTDREIRAHMLHPETGPGRVNPAAVAFTTQARHRLGSRAFNVGSRKAPGIPRGRKTGQAAYQGLVDMDPRRMVEHGVQLQGLIDAGRTWQRFVNVFGVRNHDHSLINEKSRKDAQDLADDIEHETGRKMRVIRLVPFGGRRGQLREVLEGADREGFVGENHPVTEAIGEAVKKDPQGDGPFGVVPDAAAGRLESHAGVYKATGPVGRSVTQAFRRTVLPLSLPWLTGNAVEGALRTAVRGAGPRDWLLFRRVYNQLAVGDPSIRRALRRLPEARPGSAEEQLLHMVPGGHYGGTHDTMIRATAAQFAESNKYVRKLIEALHSVHESRGVGVGEVRVGPGELARVYGAYSDWMFGSFNATIEGQFTRAMAGKFMRLSERDRGNMIASVEQAAKGITETPEQIAMADFVRRAYGQYDSFSPKMRRTILNYTPFGAWTINSFKFLYNVLPADHPIITGLIAANHQLTEDWRKDKGLDWWSDKAVPGFLQGAIPLPGGSKLRIARYTPFGTFAGSGNPLDAVFSNLLPQYSGAYMASKGLDWKGDPLRENGQEITDPYKLSLIAAREFMYATVPGIGLGARVLQKGPKRALLPAQPVPPQKGSGGGGSEFDQWKGRQDKGGGGESEFDKWKKRQGGQ